MIDKHCEAATHCRDIPTLIARCHRSTITCDDQWVKSTQFGQSELDDERQLFQVGITRAQTIAF
jgi:hypothetical protein